MYLHTLIFALFYKLRSYFRPLSKHFFQKNAGSTSKKKQKKFGFQNKVVSKILPKGHVDYSYLILEL